MLGRVKNLVLALVLLPVSSKYYSMILGRVENPVLRLELSKRHKSRAYIVSQRIIYAFFLLYLFGSAIFLLYSELFHLFSDASIFRSVVVLSRSDSYRPKLDIPFLKLLGNVHNFAMVLMLLLLPAFAATSIVGERRRGTLMLVQLSSLRPYDIVWGKMVASVAPVLVPAGVSGFVWVLYLRSLMRGDIGVGTGLWLTIAIAVPAVFVLIPFAVSAVLVLVSTFGKSSTVSITVSYVIAFILLTYALSVIPFFLIEMLVDRTYCWSTPSYAGSGCDTCDVVSPVRGFFDLCFGGEIRAHPIVRYIYFMLVPVVYACAAGLSVRWACRRLRLPAKK